MSKEKQIEEIAKDLAKHSFFYNGGCLMNYHHTAKLLYEADYRKQREGKWIDLEYYIHDMRVYECSECQNVEAIYDLTSTNFCPNCGAKMKGE